MYVNFNTWYVYIYTVPQRSILHMLLYLLVIYYYVLLYMPFGGEIKQIDLVYISNL